MYVIGTIYHVVSLSSEDLLARHNDYYVVGTT